MATITRAAPPLEAGDFLTREEFLERWEANEKIMNAELLRGVVYMPSPLSNDHSETDGKVGLWLGIMLATPGCEFGHNGTCVLDHDVAQPDMHLRILPEYGGKSWVEGPYLTGAPELLVRKMEARAK